MEYKESQDGPWPLQVVLYYGNCEVTEEEWQRVILGPFASSMPPAPADSPATFGVRSAEMARSILGQFRSLLESLTRLESTDGPKARALVDEIRSLAALQVDGFRLDNDSGRLETIWSTNSNSFREMLFAYLAICLTEVPYYWLCRCRECGIFFVERSRRRPKYCSPECRSMRTVREHRRRNPARYRERQRELMRKRRESGTPQ